MNKEESNKICELNLNDFKYLSVRFLYLNWFFPAGAEIANQLIDNTIKLYLKSINRQDLMKEIMNWRGNETHNIVRIIEKIVIRELNLDFDINQHRDILENIYKIYQNRYLSLKKTGECKTFLKDIHTIDYAYKYFRDKIKVSVKGRDQTLINKIFLRKQDLLWGEDKISLFAVFSKNNQAFKV